MTKQMPRTNWDLQSVEFRQLATKAMRKLSERQPLSWDFFLRQLYDANKSVCTYLLADLISGDAVIIDPVLEQAERDAHLIKQLNLQLKYAIDTHIHADHITGSGWLKELLPGCRSVISAASGGKADILLYENDMLTFGRHTLSVLATPGHTNGCLTFVLNEQACIFTGDAVLVRGCGRTDFQEGNSRLLYENVHRKIFSLPDYFRIYPAHDYSGLCESTVWEERLYNTFLSNPLEVYLKEMEMVKVPEVANMDATILANLDGGIHAIPRK